MKNSLKLVIGLILGGLIAILYMQKCSGVKISKNSGINLLNAMNDSLTYYRNKDSNNVATISILQFEAEKDFLALQTKDGSMQDLQRIVEEYKGKLTEGSSVTSALVETVNQLKQATQIVKHDTVIVSKENGYVENWIYPTYRDTIVDEWIEYYAQMDKDSSTLNLKVNNKFSIVIGKDKKKGSFADITTLNPYSKVKEFRTYQVTKPVEKPKRFGFGASGGATYYDGKVRPYIGLGLNYNLIRF